MPRDDTSTVQKPQKTLFQALLTLFYSIEFLWFSGQITTLIHGICFVRSALKKTPESEEYKKALFGILLSYGIIIYKIYKVIYNIYNYCFNIKHF